MLEIQTREQARESDDVSAVNRAGGAPDEAVSDGLGVPPGPWVGAALRAARQAVFAREISTGEAPAFARRAAVDYLRRQDRNE